MKLFNGVVGKFADEVKSCLSRPILAKLNVEPGWKMVLFAKDDNENIKVEIIPYNEAALFTDMSVPVFEYDDKFKAVLHKLAGTFEMAQVRRPQPIIPKDYSGSFLSYFDEIEKNCNNWNRVPPVTCILFCVNDSQGYSDEEIYNIAIRYNESLLKEDKIKNEMLKKTENLLDGILPLYVHPDKTNLN